MIFNGFTEKGIQFLKDLAANNNKDWFEQHRITYEKYLLDPLRQLTIALTPAIKSIDANIDTSPQINKTISKIFRDTRFSKDKAPLRTDLWISFRRPNKVWGNVPEFYLYFTPEEYQYGMGYYDASPANMKKFRHYITMYPNRFKKIINHYNPQNTFALMGDEYKRHLPNQFPKEYQPWFQKKSLHVSCIKKIDETFFSNHLKEELENAFVFNAELYHFLTESINSEAV